MNNIKNLTLSALFLALCMVLPLLTGQIQTLGTMLTPMHFPVFLCALICGWKYGVIVGFIAPLLRSVLFGMPPLYPTAFAMAFELATYGFVAGWLYERFKAKKVLGVYIAMVPAMIIGRLVWGLVDAICLGLAGSSLTLSVFISSILISSIPGIILQLILIPLIMYALDKAHLVCFHQS